MVPRISAVVLDAADVTRASAFWRAALGYEVAHVGDGWVSLRDPGGRGVGLDVQPNPEPKGDVNRAHVDLLAEDVEREVARLVGLGATRIPWEYPEGATFVVLRDTEGNEFCVVRS